jgi:hypothetical protein
MELRSISARQRRLLDWNREGCRLYERRQVSFDLDQVAAVDHNLGPSAGSG